MEKSGPNLLKCFGLRSRKESISDLQAPIVEIITPWDNKDLVLSISRNGCLQVWRIENNQIRLMIYSWFTYLTLSGGLMAEYDHHNGRLLFAAKDANQIFYLDQVLLPDLPEPPKETFFQRLRDRKPPQSPFQREELEAFGEFKSLDIEPYQIIAADSQKNRVVAVHSSSSAYRLASWSFPDAAKIWMVEMDMTYPYNLVVGAGEFIAVSDAVGGTQLFDNNSGDLIRSYPGKLQNPMIFSRDGKSLFMGDRDGNIDLIKPNEQWASVATMAWTGSWINDFALKNNLKIAVVATAGRGVMIWDLERSQCLLNLEVDDEVTRLLVNRTMTRVIAGTFKGKIISLDIEEVDLQMISEAQPKEIAEKSLCWDFFISHASEDKDLVARPLAQALKQAGFRVWLDESELRIGDSLRGKLDDGLKRSRHGVVVLTNHFFAKKWPQEELDALMALSGQGRKILPVWGDMEPEQVALYSPLLAGKLAANVRDGIDAVAQQIVQAVNPEHLPTFNVGSLLHVEVTGSGEIIGGSGALVADMLMAFEDMGKVPKFKVVFTSRKICSEKLEAEHALGEKHNRDLSLNLRRELSGLDKTAHNMERALALLLKKYGNNSLAQIKTTVEGLGREFVRSLSPQESYNSELRQNLAAIDLFLYGTSVRTKMWLTKDQLIEFLGKPTTGFSELTWLLTMSDMRASELPSELYWSEALPKMLVAVVDWYLGQDSGVSHEKLLDFNNWQIGPA